MLVVAPSYEIQDALDHLPLPVALETRGRVCYKSEEKISGDSAIPFVEGIVRRGHGSVLEMAVVTAEIACSPTDAAAFFALQPRFFVIDKREGGLLVTASIRALRELATSAAADAVVATFACAVSAKYPFLFADINLATPSLAPPRLYSVSEIDAWPQALLARHRFLGVKFVVSRAVSHELVRHRVCSFLQESQRYCNYGRAQFDRRVSFIRPVFYQENSEEFAIWQQSMEEAESAYLRLLRNSTPQAARTVLPNSCKTEIVVYCNLAEWRHMFRLRTASAAEPSMREVMLPLQAELRRRYSFL
ncbi:MAG: FAD-dependent thymidylate synthase [Desulfobulbaceae bacterium]|jgi:thymidylate synthase (FAD)|nr:FAD-dependent thymidylate synthase [Desulfobulbaceae bacterium]